MIELQNINKKFDNHVLFTNFNLRVDSGEFIGILGKSGQGKTTLLNIMGALENPDSGIVKIKGKNTQKMKRLLLRDELGFIFQNFALVDNLTVRNNLEIALKHKRMKKQESEKQMEWALKQVDLAGYSSKKIYNLSGGEQQRIAIARLLLKDPSIILADEPTGSLDSENRDIIVTLFKKLHNTGKTIVMVTHDEDLISHFSRTIQL
ncbi:ABC transporter ATP-binding protein [Listeria fleischmannii]|uniref:ABC transporter ATP-binding protein n=1 Tax=Listeria fleischmannii TaxID=1069827 RepID=UPI001627ADE5|nr:putative bacteriocin export ABC transporter [Listeria fleischmannii]MBC1417950.1 putative bacteriocin export ABC transporter [Listeria fleischmannii]